MKQNRCPFFSMIALLSLVAPAGAFVFSPAQTQPFAMRAKPPELVGTEWVNTKDDKPITLESRKGKVTIVHYWTFGCINCQRNLPAYQRWYKELASKGVEIIGIHTPETPSEKVSDNVRKKVKELEIAYPVLIDGKSENWKRWDQQVWPTVYLVDKQGNVRYRWVGELDWQGAGGEAKMRKCIAQLMNERG